MKYFIHLAYNGSNYSGWQRQKNVISIQEILEDTLTKMLGYQVLCTGCGRTDKGVHASQYICHIFIKEALTYDPVFRLNKMLPNDIVIYELIPVADRAQAQYDVVDRTYTYHIRGQESPFFHQLSALCAVEQLDIKRMEQATTMLIGRQDFKSFCKKPDVYKHTFCDVQEATLTLNSPQHLQFSITANRFIRGMVRLVVGNLLAIGTGALSLELFENALKTQTALPYFRMAYPQGLYLSKVRYIYLELPSRSLSNFP